LIDDLGVICQRRLSAVSSTYYIYQLKFRKRNVQLQLLDYNELPYRQTAITSEIVKECPSSEIGFSAPRVPWSDIQSDLVNAACGRVRISSILKSHKAVP
jgi:hypothetical protein